ncbi:MAG: heme biosynthesis HemY N-terminal domain-containing protein [Pseudomonadales bacterium]
MSVRLLKLLVLLVIGALVGILVARDPGYVLVVYGNRALETGLWVALVLLASAYVGLRALLFVLGGLRRGPRGILRWQAERRRNRTIGLMQGGLAALVQGDWREARARFEGAAGKRSGPLPWLGAALAARLGEDGAAEARLIEQATQQDADAAAFALARQQADRGEWGAVASLVRPLAERSPPHREALWLCARAAVGMGDSAAFATLLPALRQARPRGEAEIDQLQVASVRGELAQLSGEGLESRWQSLTKDLRSRTELVLDYVRRAGREHPDRAESVVQEALSHHWSVALVAALGEIPVPDPLRTLKRAEGWVEKHADEPALFLTLGRLALRAGRWAEAREHLEMAVRRNAGPVAQAELGRLIHALGDARGIELMVNAAGALPDLPLPRTGPI